MCMRDPLGFGDTPTEPNHPKKREAPEMTSKDQRCAALDHPAGCYNPWLNETFCICGAVRYAGHRAVRNRPMPPEGWLRADRYSYDEFTGEWTRKAQESAA